MIRCTLQDPEAIGLALVSVVGLRTVRYGSCSVLELQRGREAGDLL